MLAVHQENILDNHKVITYAHKRIMQTYPVNTAEQLMNGVQGEFAVAYALYDIGEVYYQPMLKIALAELIGG